MSKFNIFAPISWCKSKFTSQEAEIEEVKSSLTNYATNTSLANALAWKVLKTNATSVSLASIWDSFNEIQVLARYKYDSSQTYCTSTIIPKQEIPDGSNSHTYMFFSGSRFASTTGIGARIDVYQSTVKLNGFYVDGTSKTSNIYIDVLYR